MNNKFTCVLCSTDYDIYYHRRYGNSVDRYYCNACSRQRGIPFISNKTPKPKLIGFTGNIGSGKSTVAKYITQGYMSYKEYSFADPLKKIASVLGFEETELYGTQEQKLQINKFWGISGRHFLQVFGSEVCRDYLPKVLPDMKFNNKTLWIRLFEKYYYENKKKNIVVSDVRFIDEAQCITNLGGYIIRIEREIQNSGVVYMHQSEMQINKIKPNVIIKNNGTLNQLSVKVIQMLELIEQGFADIPNTVIYL